MSMTVGDFFWDRMSQWGVKTIFGYPGDGINGLMGGLERARNQKVIKETAKELVSDLMPSRS